MILDTPIAFCNYPGHSYAFQRHSKNRKCIFDAPTANHATALLYRIAITPLSLFARRRRKILGFWGSESIETPLNLIILEVQIALKMKENDARE